MSYKNTIYEKIKKKCNPKPKYNYGCHWLVCIMSSTKKCDINYCPQLRGAN